MRFSQASLDSKLSASDWRDLQADIRFGLHQFMECLFLMAFEALLLKGSMKG